MKEEMKEFLSHIESQASLYSALKSVNFLPTPHYSDAQWTVLQSLLEVLPHACAQLIVYYQACHQIDFSGIAQGALQALNTGDAPTDLVLKLDFG